MKVLTLKELKSMEPNSIFAQGTFLDSPEGCNIADTGLMVRWVAVRGGIHDWAIYCQNPYSMEDTTIGDTTYFGNSGVWDWQMIADQGDKITSEENIRKLVPCDNESFKMYRY